MSYKEVGEIDQDTLIILMDWVEEAEWSHANEGERDYHVWYVHPEDVEEVLPVFHKPIQQFFLKIAPNGRVHRHVDRRKGTTYHVPVYSNDLSHCFMHTPKGTKAYHLEVGKIYEVDRSIEHSSQNLGDTDRIHLLVEV